MNHAPSPWSYNPDDVDWGFVRDADGLVMAQIKDNRVTREEMVKARRDHCDPFADTSRLISAAPEMLIALKNLIEVIGCDYCDGRLTKGRSGKCESCWDDTKKAREAIAKAEGKL